MEFPRFLTMGKLPYAVSKTDSQKLIGCNVEIRGVPVRWVLESDRFRVYELICRDKNVMIGGLEKETKIMNDMRAWSLMPILFIEMLLIAILIFDIRRERKLQ